MPQSDTTNEAALKLARELHAKFKNWGSGSPFWDDLRAALARGAFDADDTIQIALAAILEVTERAAGLAEATRADEASEWDSACLSIATALRDMEHLS